MVVGYGDEQDGPNRRLYEYVRARPQHPQILADTGPSMLLDWKPGPQIAITR